jgi:hypothetical protein
MVRLGETELKKLLQGGDMDTVKLKVAVPRSVEMAEHLCGMANARGGFSICQRLSKKSGIFPWSIIAFEPFSSIDTTFQDGVYVPNSPHIRHLLGHSLLVPPIVLSEMPRICAWKWLTSYRH